MAVVSVTPKAPTGVSVSARGVRGPQGPALEVRDVDGVLEWRVTDQNPPDTWKSLIDIAQYVTDAEDARDLAQKWATEDEDVAVSGGLYSALHHALKAAASASTADGDASAASLARSDAEDARDLAADWAEKPDGQDVDGAGTRSAKHHAGVASAAASTATGAASIATTKAGEALGHADDAAAWAEGTTPGGPGTKSAKEHALDAAQSALDAATFDPSSYTPTAELAAVALTGDYADLTGKPSLFSGSYNDLSDKPALGNSSGLDVGTAAGTVAAGDDSRITGAAQKSANLDDLADKATAFNNIKQNATDSVTGVVELADASEIRGASGSTVVTSGGIASASALTTPSGSSNFAPDWSAFIVADWTVNDNRTLSNPTNVIVGTTRYVFVRASSGTRTISFGSNYKGDIPTLNDVTSSKWYLLCLVAYSSSHIVVTAVEASS